VLTWFSSFDEFAFHLHTNTIGPIITAQKLLQTNIPIGTIVFMSSDSGSHGNFREMEDGFAAYAASKAALNMAMRHMAAELKRKDDDTIILAMHPGEVQTYVSQCTPILLSTKHAIGIWRTLTCLGQSRASYHLRNRCGG
jgi:NAD(P)-dependent dehydrogenase (short-subunit alcohol dehydrogenase family)